MYISAYAHPRWFESQNDDDLRFLKQLGVDHVNISLSAVKGYRESGVFHLRDLLDLVERLDALGLKIERVTASRRHIVDAALGRPEGGAQIEHLSQVTEMLGEARIPVMYFPGHSAGQLVPGVGSGAGEEFFPGQYAGQLIDPTRPGWREWTGRGGYVAPAYDDKAAQAPNYQPTARITSDQLWEGLLNIYRRIMPVSEKARVLIAQHGIDPPVPKAVGNPQILCTLSDFERLYAQIPSPNNGMTFCLGTRYESGEDVFEGIRRFGGQGRIFHVHFRNVRGTLPRGRGYAEAFIDDGDLNMRDVLQSLHDVGYERALDYDHVVRLAGDSYIGRQYVAYAVGYIKGLLAGLSS